MHNQVHCCCYNFEQIVIYQINQDQENQTLRERSPAIQSQQGNLTLHCHQWIDLSETKNQQEFSDLKHHMDLTDIYRTFHPKFFSSAHRIFSKIDLMLGHKISFNKFKKIEIISCIFLDHNGMKLDVNHKKKLTKYISQ